MSIYATLWSIQVQDPASDAPLTKPRWVKVTAQAVPPHIGSPTPGCGYENGDLYAAFLPPPIETDEEGKQAEFNRCGRLCDRGNEERQANRSGRAGICEPSLCNDGQGVFEDAF